MPASRSIIFPKSFMVANQEPITGNDSKRWRATMRSQQLHPLLHPIVDDNGGVRSATTSNLATQERDFGSKIWQPNPKIHQIQPSPTPSPISHNLAATIVQKFGKIHGFSTVSIHPVRSAASSSPCAGGSGRTRHGRLNDIAAAIRPVAAAAFFSITAGKNPSLLPLTASEPSCRHASAQPPHAPSLVENPPTRDAMNAPVTIFEFTRCRLIGVGSNGRGAWSKTVQISE
ncbi:hypothetical protein ACLOJK_027714 [Asimina triloba]